MACGGDGMRTPNVNLIDGIIHNQTKCGFSFAHLKVVVAYWKVKTPCHAHGECIN